MGKPNYPRPGWVPGKKRTETILLICCFERRSISTIPENISYLQGFSSFPIRVANLYEGRRNKGLLTLNPLTRLDHYNAVLIHNTVAYNPDHLESLDTEIAPRFDQYDGIKILFKQDENYRSARTARFIGSREFDLVFTCLPEAEVSKVYPARLSGSPRFVRMLTGYVTPNLRNLRIDENRTRPIDIGYRGSIQPLSFGWLAYEKKKIGDDVAVLAARKGLVTDISSRWEDRFGGSAWLDFLGRCKATLGVESGASIFDLDGTLEARCAGIEEELATLHGQPGFAEEFLDRLKNLEGNIYYNQVSPRHFEAAATRTLQVLFPGRYSGILSPGRHYLALERDYRNFDEVAGTILDARAREEIVERAFEEVIQSRDHWIETFVEHFDAALSESLERKGRINTPVIKRPAARCHVVLIAPHELALDPRLDWIARHAPDGMRIHQVGVSRKQTDPSYHPAATGGSEIAYPSTKYIEGCEWLSVLGVDGSLNHGAAELSLLHSLYTVPEHHLVSWLGAIPNTDRIQRFKRYLGYFLDTNATLIRHVSAMRGTDALIATDLPTLPAALVLKEQFNIPVFYDAHEYWPEADVESADWEVQFWLGMEQRLVQRVDYAQTVSTGLADLMSTLYGQRFGVLPNCEPLHIEDEEPDAAYRRDNDRGDRCVFLFLGNFAPRRGIDLLIKAWAKTHRSAILHLRGPGRDYKTKMIALARSVGLYGNRIFFPEAVAESDLVKAAREADVGLIPYTPYGSCYRYCCPNKLSQYMAAGLPIIANKLDYVESVLIQAGCGVNIDFSNEDRLAATINHYASDPARRKAEAERGLRYCRQEFNWQKLSRPFYAALEALTENRQGSEFSVYAAPAPLSASVDAKSVASGTPAMHHVKAAARPAPDSVSAALRLSALLAAKRLWHFLPEDTRHRWARMARIYVEKLGFPRRAGL